MECLLRKVTGNEWSQSKKENMRAANGKPIYPWGRLPKDILVHNPLACDLHTIIHAATGFMESYAIGAFVLSQCMLVVCNLFFIFYRGSQLRIALHFRRGFELRLLNYIITVKILMALEYELTTF